jgi:hypothetical protein
MKTFLSLSVFASVIILAESCVKASVLTVTSLADSGSGSLRDQVAASAAGDTIQFSVNGSILLNSSITISHTLTIQGQGPANLTVDAGFHDRAFVLSGDLAAFLSGMTITHGLVMGTAGTDGGVGQDGQAGGDAVGGAILDTGGNNFLILSNCWLTDNAAIGGPGGRGGDAGSTAHAGNGGDGGVAGGGAVYMTGHSVSNVCCTYSQNRAVGGRGGDGGDSANPSVAGGNGGAGGAASSGALNADVSFDYNCTFSGNAVSGSSGGNGGNSFGPVFGAGGAGGQGGPNEGGAIVNTFGHFLSCTIVSNSAFASAGGTGGSGSPSGANGASDGGNAGGYLGYIYAGCLSTIGNTILADNTADTHTNYYAAWNDSGYNFIGSDDYDLCGWDASSQVGTVANPIHPQLGPLAQNGSGLPTHAITLTSPVTDAGTSLGLTTDERGAPRPYAFGAPKTPGGDASDIGAFELGSADLSAAMSMNGLVLSWPAFYGDFTLQSETNLQESNIWSDVSDAPVVLNNQFVVTNCPTNPIIFFRLIVH